MKLVQAVIIFFLVFFLYLGVSTRFTFVPKWAIDYFNPLAQSLLQGRLDLINPSMTYDLELYQGKWYVPWGVLPSLFLLPLILLKGRFVPAIYLSIFFASLNVVLVYFLLQRMKREFFPYLSQLSIFLLISLFAFGTTHFYVGTLGSSWHVDEMVSFFWATLGLYIIFKPKRTIMDYFFSTACFSITLIGRAVFVFLVSIPTLFYVWDYLWMKRLSFSKKITNVLKGVVIFGIPLGIFTLVFFLYNTVRFDSPFEYGYRYIHEAPYLQQIREANGVISLKNVPNNLWYMLLEIPSLSLDNGIALGFNLKGNSIFFLTPPFLAAFLASPFTRRRQRRVLNPYILSLWVAVIVAIIPILLFYSTGWMQFGYRYSLGVTVMLLLLSLFGIQGRLNVLYILGIIFSIAMYLMGITALL